MYVFGQEYYKWFQNIASPQKSSRELLTISSPIPDLVKSEFTGMDLGTSVFEAGIVSHMVQLRWDTKTSEGTRLGKIPYKVADIIIAEIFRNCMFMYI